MSDGLERVERLEREVEMLRALLRSSTQGQLTEQPGRLRFPQHTLERYTGFTMLKANLRSQVPEPPTMEGVLLRVVRQAQLEAARKALADAERLSPTLGECSREHEHDKRTSEARS